MMKKLLLIISAVFLSLWLMGYFMEIRYKKYWWPFFEKLDVLVNDSTNYDGIFLGDSRVHFGINPYYVDSITGLKTYNFGMGGTPVKEIEYTVKNYLQKHPAPRFAILSIGYTGIIESYKYFNNPCYYFFYTKDALTKAALQNAGYHTSLYQIFPFAKFTAFDDFNKLSIAQNLQGKTIVKPGGIAYHGFINNDVNNFNVNIAENSGQQDTTVTAGLAIFENIIGLLQAKHTKVILIYPPEATLNNATRTNWEIQLDGSINQIANKFNCPLVYFNKDTSFQNHFFTDPWHLNVQGTIVYSKKIAALINESLLTKKKAD